ncbi:MAG: 2-ketoisovalerate ferredoxin oxidoreductase [Chloroflexi bacterium RBG_13_48_17]|nr:MAG: 2-ketoisovalerate ferredoxin oxidoreductase [Chloroflexi bacterium RBG_13_48_17]
MKVNAVNLTETEYILPGNRTCLGCGLSIAYRHILKALDGQVIVTVPASCLTVLHGMYPITAVNVPCVNTPFASTGASATGLAAGLRATGRKGITVLAIAGDGGTHDIGIQSLSGAAERQEDFIYICYDNEGYMNTGNQRSGSTPLGAITGTTPVLGKRQNPKDIAAIMEAHCLPYIATANASYPLDLYEKARKAKGIKGTRFIHVFAPCPPGWQFPYSDTVKIGRLAVETGLFVLYEVKDGIFHLTSASESLARKGNLKPVREYLAEQGRFKNLTEEQISQLQDWVNVRWQCYLERSANPPKTSTLSAGMTD